MVNRNTIYAIRNTQYAIRDMALFPDPGSRNQNKVKLHLSVYDFGLKGNIRFECVESENKS